MLAFVDSMSELTMVTTASISSMDAPVRSSATLMLIARREVIQEATNASFTKPTGAIHAAIQECVLRQRRDVAVLCGTRVRYDSIHEPNNESNHSY